MPFRLCLRLYAYYPYSLIEDRALLDRWWEHPDAQRLWDTLRAHSEQHVGPIGTDAPFQFIEFILRMKFAAELKSQKNAKLAAGMAEIKKLKSEITRQVALYAKHMPFEKRAEFWERTGKQLQECPPLDTFPPGLRSDRNGSRARTYFIREVSGFVHDTTARWLDEQVAMITGIAFNMDISNDAVRRARS
jgi:hypothetical protein